MQKVLGTPRSSVPNAAGTIRKSLELYVDDESFLENSYQAGVVLEQSHSTLNQFMRNLVSREETPISIYLYNLNKVFVYICYTA